MNKKSIKHTFGINFDQIRNFLFTFGYFEFNFSIGSNVTITSQDFANFYIVICSFTDSKFVISLVFWEEIKNIVKLKSAWIKISWKWLITLANTGAWSLTSSTEASILVSAVNPKLSVTWIFNKYLCLIFNFFNRDKYPVSWSILKNLSLELSVVVITFLICLFGKLKIEIIVKPKQIIIFNFDEKIRENDTYRNKFGWMLEDSSTISNRSPCSSCWLFWSVITNLVIKKIRQIKTKTLMFKKSVKTAHTWQFWYPLEQFPWPVNHLFLHYQSISQIGHL